MPIPTVHQNRDMVQIEGLPEMKPTDALGFAEEIIKVSNNAEGYWRDRMRAEFNEIRHRVREGSWEFLTPEPPSNPG